MSSWPLTTVLVRLAWLRALSGVAEGAFVPPIPAPAADAAGSCVAAVLGEAMQRLCIFGGRSGMPRSLGSVLGCLVARFLGGFQGCRSRCIPTLDVVSWSNSAAISRDGSKLLVADDCSNEIRVFAVANGMHLRSIGGKGAGPLQFKWPRQVWIASDDFVFVADAGNNRIQVLTPRFEFNSFVGLEQLCHPGGVCADDDVVAISEVNANRISVFQRSNGALLRRFGCEGSGDGQLRYPHGLCFSGRSSIAVADSGNDRISVVSLAGDFIRTVGAGKLNLPMGVACSVTGDELVIADFGHNSVVVFDADGDLLHAIANVDFCCSVAIHSGTIIAQSFKREKCVFFT